jgi:type IX secretion system PorP/SprF family membrane protein
MKTRYILTILAAFSFVGMGSAQQLPFSTQYFTNMFTVNPAFTGVDEYGQIFLSHRSQYYRLEGGPQTSYMSIDGKVGDNFGLGLIAFHDQTDLLSRTSAMVNYSYALHFSAEHYLTMGVAAGVQNNAVDYDKAMVVDANDPILFSTRQNRTVFNADIGLGYRWNALQVGVAVPQVLIKQPDFTDNTGNQYHL